MGLWYIQLQREIENFINQGRIDLILLDVMLGEENGVELCRKLRTQQDVPIIFVLAPTTRCTVGADDYIGKPFNLDLLLARVRAVLRRVQRSSSLVYRRNIYTYHFKGWKFSSKTSEAFNPQGVQIAVRDRLLKVFFNLLSLYCSAMDVTNDGQSISDNSGRALDVLVGE